MSMTKPTGSRVHQNIILDGWDGLAAEHRLKAAEVLNIQREIRQMGEQGSFYQVQHALSDIGLSHHGDGEAIIQSHEMPF